MRTGGVIKHYIMKNYDYFTVKELAKLLKVSTQTITERLRRGTLKGEKVGREWVIKKNVI